MSISSNGNVVRIIFTLENMCLFCLVLLSWQSFNLYSCAKYINKLCIYNYFYIECMNKQIDFLSTSISCMIIE